MSIAFKRFLKVTLVLLLIVLDILAIMALLEVLSSGKHTIDTEEFESVIEWGDELDLSGINIVDNRVLGMIEKPLTEDMIVSIDDIDEAGRKKIVFVYDKKEYTVFFDVKYRVEFLSYGEMIDSQLVFNAEELTLPTPTPKDGHEFSHWDYDFSLGLSGNVVARAVYKVAGYPKLEILTATYGDTLGDLTLPSNELGRWEFLNPVDTPVGNAGKQSFSVRFVINGDDSLYEYDFVDVNVNKKQLEFDNVTDSFVYDGEEHFPTYTLSEDVEVVATGTHAISAGTYAYTLEIIDDNYCGEYAGSYEITKPTVTVTVSSAEITYPASVPEFTYTVEGFADTDLLGISIDAPTFASAVGEYEIGITYTNENVNYIIHKGILVVNKGDLAVEAPRISEVTFEDKLSDIEFVGSFLGTWTWENPDTVINSMSGISAYAIFTHDDPNLNTVRMLIEITDVKKKSLTITVTNDTFIYSEGVNRSVEYKISGGLYPDVYDTLAVSGNVSKTYAGSYTGTLVIDDERYTGTVPYTLVIAKADVVVDFDISVSDIWIENMRLDSLDLPDGFAWANPSQLIPGAGSYKYYAIYTPEDELNYNTAAGEIEVNVSKAVPNIEGMLDSYSKTYDKSAYEFDCNSLSVKYTDGSLSVSYEKDGVSIDSPVNAGEYTIVITLTEGTNYSAVTLKRTLTISPAENKQTVKTEQTAVFGNGLDVLVLPEDDGEGGNWSWYESEIGSAGTKTFTAIFDPGKDGNYKPRTVTVTVVVYKKPIDVPSLSDKQYTGSEISAGVTSTDDYKAGGDLTATNVGTYTVTFTLEDPDNCEWVGSEGLVTVSRTYRISEAPNSWKSEPQNVTMEYKNTASTLAELMPASANHGTNVTYTINGETVESLVLTAGTYTVIVTVTADNYDDLVATRTITVTKQTVIAPTAPEHFEFNNSSHTIDITDENLDVLYEIYSEQSGTNVGDTVSTVLKLKDSANYKWNSGSGETVTLESGIVAATLSFKDTTTLTNNSWIYSSLTAAAEKTNAKLASLSDSFSEWGVVTELRYSYEGESFVTYEQLEKTTAGFLKAGSYKVKTVAVGTNNWETKETEAIEFTIGKATPDIILAQWNGPKNNGQYYQNLTTLNTDSSKVYYSGNSTLTVEGTLSFVRFEFSEGTSTFYVTFDPSDDINYEAGTDGKVTLSNTISLKTVATIGHNSATGYKAYGSIENALSAATSGVVWVIPDITGNVRIVEDVVINSGVTLRLPYGDTSSDYNNGYKASLYIGDNESTGDVLAEEKSAYLKTYVILSANKKITVNGTLDISGELSGGGWTTNYVKYAGQTSRNYALLELESGAKIDISGTVNALGFIRETTKNNGSTVTVGSGAYLYQPLVLRDFRTGNYMSAATESKDWTHGFAPFVRFIFMNVSPETTIYSGGYMMGTANLYAGKMMNNAVAAVVGTGSSDFLKIDGRLVAKYDTDTEIMKVHMYGGATLNDFTLKAGGLVGTVSSSDYVFGLSYHYDIILDADVGHTAVYTMSSRYKMLPGAKITIEKNATLNVDSIHIYEEGTSFSLTDNKFYEVVEKANSDGTGNGTFILHYPYGMGDAELLVRGTLIANSIGGKVWADSNDAKVTVKSSVSVTTYEITKYCYPANALSLGTVKEYETITNTLKLCYGTNVIDGVAGKDYKSKNGAWAVVESFMFTVPDYYEISCTDANGNAYTSEGKTGADRIVELKINSDVTIIVGKNYLYLDSAASEYTFTSLDDLNARTNCSVTWKATENSLPAVYYVPALTINGIENVKNASVSITYKLSSGTEKGKITSVVIKSVGSSWFDQGESFTVGTTTAKNESSMGVNTYTYTHPVEITSDTTLEIS